MKWFIKCLKLYADFSGRAQRKEYWMFTLFYVIFYFASGVLISGLSVGLGEQGQQTAIKIAWRVYILAFLIPSLAVGVRRLHDIGKSGWWMLLALIPFIGWIVLFIFFVLDSEQGDNAYGVDPKGRQSNFVHRQNEYFDSANFTHSENRKEENSFSQKCQRCSKTVLKRSDFTAELSKMGLKLDAGGNITVSGAFSGYGALQNLQQKVAKMEGDKAIQCKSCGKVYCVDCLAIYAPQHPTSGGKACFSCRGSLQEI